MNFKLNTKENATSNYSTYYFPNLYGESELKGGDIDLLKKTPSLIKGLINVDNTPAARVLDNALENYVTSSKKVASAQKLKEMAFGVTTSIYLLLIIPLLFGLPILAPLILIPIMGSILTTLACTVITITPLILYLTSIHFIEKLLDHRQKTMAKKADKLNTYCDEAERELLKDNKESKLISKENNPVEGFKIQYPPMFSLPASANNNDEVDTTLQATQRLNNMTLATNLAS